MEYRRIVFATLALQLIFALLYASCLSGCRARDDQRELTLSDFDFLEGGMSQEEIIDRLGLPDRFVGSGISRIQYDLADGRMVDLAFLPGLFDARVQEKDGTWIDLLEEQN